MEDESLDDTCFAYDTKAPLYALARAAATLPYVVQTKIAAVNEGMKTVHEIYKLFPRGALDNTTIRYNDIFCDELRHAFNCDVLFKKLNDARHAFLNAQ